MGSRSQESVEEKLREAVDRALRILLRCFPDTSGSPLARHVEEELAVAVRLLDERPDLEVLDGAGLIRSAADHLTEGKWGLARDVLVTARGRLIREHARRGARACRELRDE